MSLNSSLTRREFVRNSLFVAAAPALVRAGSLMMIKPWKESILWRVLGVTYGLGWGNYYATPYDASPLQVRRKSLQFMKFSRPLMNFSMPPEAGLSPGDIVEFNSTDFLGTLWKKGINDDPHQFDIAKRLLG